MEKQPAGFHTFKIKMKCFPLSSEVQGQGQQQSSAANRKSSVWPTDVRSTWSEPGYSV